MKDSATNLALSGVTVSCTSGFQAGSPSVTTDASGNYSFSGANKLSFPGNGPQTLTLTFSKSGYTNGTITLSVNNGDEFTNQNVALTSSTKKLTVTKTGAGTGTVTSSPAGIDCGATCSFNFNNNTNVTLTATAGANSTFNGWSGDGTGTTTRTVTMDADKSVSALFKANQAALNYTGPTSGTYGDKLNLSSSGGSGTGALTYDVGSSTACALGTGADAGKLLITSGTGSCSVTVNKAADGDYNPATSGPQTITVNKANQTITFTSTAPTNAVYADTYTPTATGGGSGNPVTFGASGACSYASVVTMTQAGTCTVTANQAGEHQLQRGSAGLAGVLGRQAAG